MNAAYEIGKKLGMEKDGCSKAERKSILAAAGLDVCVVCQSFEQGRQAGIAERKIAEAPQRALDAALRAKHERLAQAVSRDARRHRGEEMHVAAARKLMENLGVSEIPAEIAAILDE